MSIGDRHALELVVIVADDIFLLIADDDDEFLSSKFEQLFETVRQEGFAIDLDHHLRFVLRQGSETGPFAGGEYDGLHDVSFNSSETKLLSLKRTRTLLRICTHTIYMSKNISISDDVYRRLKREKGDRSFSELIAEKLDDGGTIAEVTGQDIFGPETEDRVADEITRLSRGTMERLDDETA